MPAPRDSLSLTSSSSRSSLLFLFFSLSPAVFTFRSHRTHGRHFRVHGSFPVYLFVFTRSRDALAAPYARYVYFIYKYVNKLRLYSYIVQWRLACAQVIPDLPSLLPSDLANEKTLAAFSGRGNFELRFQQLCNCCKHFYRTILALLPACY